jgi:energy-coupling factor transporter ATP-binding protein EcfA2
MRTSELTAVGPADTALVIGPPGVGKSTLVKNLKDMGRQAVDADTVEGLGRWSCLAGHNCRPRKFKLEPPYHPDKDWPALREIFSPFEPTYQPDAAWRAHHTYKWGIDAMQRLIDSRDRRRPLYVVGTSQNTLSVFDAFDTKILLTASTRVLAERLRSPSRETPYSFVCDETYEASLSPVLAEHDKRVMKFLGGTIIDTEVSPANIAYSVIRTVES